MSVSTVGYRAAGAEDTADVRARTAAYLAYTEEVLRHKSCRQLPGHLRRRRYQMLKLLHAYCAAGEFARQPALSGGLLDAAGRPNALGYLMQHTGGQALLAEINRQHPAARIEAIDNAALRHWVDMSGLTLEECAQIQRAN